MAAFKCKACGAPLCATEGQIIVECTYCDLQQTIPQLDDEFKLQTMNRANELRRQFDFDGARALFQSVISRYPKEAEAYWGICLCKYGIMYVEDQQTFARIPTFYRMIPQSILSDECYENTCRYAGEAMWKYQEEALKIDRLQKKIIQLSTQESPCEIFICYKKTDMDTGACTKDSRIASQIYTMLIENGYRVFWAERSLPGGCEYEPYIYAALSSAKIMLVLGSDSRYFEATWVKNEWVRFLDMMGRDSSKALITCYCDMAAEDIPSKLQSLQALDMNNTLFSADLLRHIQKRLPQKTKSTEDERLIELLKRFQTAGSDSGAAVPSTHYREIELNDGVYQGDAIAGKPHGKGTCYFSNGERYEGNWNAGKKHGNGTYYYVNGDSWSGEWDNDRPWNGNGKYYDTSSDSSRVECYEGELKKGLLCGNGKKYLNGVLTREGIFENGMLNGNGISYIKGQKCSGEFKKGRPWNAEGFFLLEKCENFEGYYCGAWSQGRPNGKGIATSKDGKESIEGEFKGGLNGWVTWRLETGELYVGSIINGEFSGAGKLFEVSGSLKYAGEFLKDRPHGQGSAYYPSGGSWTGEWKNGSEWKGKGLILFYDDKGQPTGKFYNGYVVNGQAAGRGMLRFEDGTRFDGEFLNNEYYNGYIYDAQNRVVDTVINGVSQAQKNREASQRAWNTAAGVLNFISKL